MVPFASHETKTVSSIDQAIVLILCPGLQRLTKFLNVYLDVVPVHCREVLAAVAEAALHAALNQEFPVPVARRRKTGDQGKDG
jgi:hypothetical protein